MKYTAFRKSIRRAVNRALEAGWIFGSEVSIDRDNKVCCPLGALGIPTEATTYNEAYRQAGVTGYQAAAFITGFDGDVSEEDIRHYSRNDAPKFLKLGQKYREELGNNV